MKYYNFQFFFITLLYMAKNFFLKNWEETLNGIDYIKRNIGHITFNTVPGESGAEGQLFNAPLADSTYILAKSSAAEEKYKFMFQKEDMIGKSLQKLREYIPNFMLTFGSYICPSSNINKNGNLCDGGHNMKYYILLEPVDCPLDEAKPICNLEKYLDSNLFNDYDYIQFVQILVISLLIAKEACNFTHNDFNPKNICLHDMKKMTKLIYDYHGVKYTFMTRYLPVIVDYGPSYSNDVTFDELGETTNENMEHFVEIVLSSRCNEDSMKQFISENKITGNIQSFLNNMINSGCYSFLEAPAIFFPIKNSTIKEDIVELVRKSIRKCKQLERLLLESPDKYLATLENIKNNLQEDRIGTQQYTFTYPPVVAGGYYEKYQKYKKIYLQKKYGI